MSIRILHADDHPLVRAGIRTTLSTEPEFIVVGEACDGNEAQVMCLELQPDVLLLDLCMPGPLAEETIRSVKFSCKNVKIIIQVFSYIYPHIAINEGVIMVVKKYWIICILVIILTIQGCVDKKSTSVGSASESPLSSGYLTPSTSVTPFNGAAASVTSTISPTKPPTVTVTATSTLVPAGVFALKFYPPLIMNYDFSVWKDESQYDNNSMMVNFLQAQNLSTCMIGPDGPSGHFPSPDAIIMLGKIHYEFSSMQSSVDGMMIGVYIVDSSVDPSQTLPGYDSIHGLPKLNVIANALEWEQCKDLAEGVLATLHSSTPPFISVPTETVVPPSASSTQTSDEEAFSLSEKRVQFRINLMFRTLPRTG